MTEAPIRTGIEPSLTVGLMPGSTPLGNISARDNSRSTRYNSKTKPGPKQMRLMDFRKTLSTALLLFAVVTAVTAQRPQRRRLNRPAPAIPAATLIRILRAEDDRRWDEQLQSLLSDKDARVRKRAALAAGRIGDERALPALADLLKSDPDNDVRQMAAFAIGETESYAGSDALYRILVDTSQPREISARAVEAE